MSNGNGPFQRNPPGGIYGPGGIVQNISSQPGQKMVATLTPGPSIPSDNAFHSISYGTGSITQNSIGASILQYDTFGNNLTNIGPASLTLSVTAYVTMPAVATTTLWTLALNQNVTSAVFDVANYTQPADSANHSFGVSGVVLLTPGQSVRVQIGQPSGGTAYTITTTQLYVANIGSS